MMRTKETKRGIAREIIREITPPERLLMICFGLALAVLLLTGGFVLNMALPVASSNSADHSHEVIAEINQLRAGVDNAENGQRGYFLTSEKHFLAQRDGAVAAIKATFVQLQTLTADNPSQQERISRLQAAVDQRISILAAANVVFEAQGFNATKSLFLAGHEASKTVRAFMEETEKAEQTLLARRKDGELSRIKIILAGIVALLAFVPLLFVLIQRAIRRREADSHALEEARQPLMKIGALQDAIFNSANFSSIATDAKGVIQIFNVGAERMLGYAAADVMNKITPADISDPQEVIARAKALSVELDTPIAPGFEALVFKASRGIEDIYELTYIRKDGSRFPAVVSVTALRDAEGIIIGYLLIGTDNTARKRIEEERVKLDQRLRDQQFYTRSLIESNIDALMTTDPQGIITDVNKQMEALTGCTRDELIGAPFKNCFTDPDRAEAGVKLVLAEGKVTNYELTAHARDGAETVVSYNATTFYDRDRKLQGVFAAARDVTERKLIDVALQKNNLELEAAKAIAEKANLAKSEFLSSMSHELRTPLNAVLGFAQVMATDMPPPSALQQRSIERILQAGWYLLRLINEILDLATVESGKVTISQEPMSLDAVLQDCQAMIEPQAATRGVQMSFPRFETPVYVYADRIRVKQVIVNLLSNAIKYNRRGGSVSVQCAASTSNQVRVSVTDTGPGLTPEQVAQLFQPFNRLGRETGPEEGTGIGLVVTKRLVELMGGIIGIESKVGVGSVFWFELPAASAPRLAADAADGDASAGGTDQPEPGATPAPGPVHTLLYVEDNPANLELVEQLIARRSDLKLLTAIDGHLGLAVARLQRPDVILLDINLPGIGGFDVLKMLQEDAATAHIPVLALSANAVPRGIAKGLEAGFFRYLTKPVKIGEFMEALDLALEHAAQQKISAVP